MTTAGVTRGPNFDHLRRMTDENGIFEHALGSDPRPDHGYCVDDVARGLVVLCRVREPDRALQHMTRTYLSFTLSAIGPTGAAHNRMATGGGWTDDPDLGDWWGRALWGLGAAAAGAPSAPMRAEAVMGFRLAARRRSPNLRSMVFAGLGAGQVLRVRPDEPAALDILRDTVTAIGPISAEDVWPWPEPRLSYANGAIVEALLLAGQALSDERIQQNALALLEFLIRTESRDGRLSVTPAVGRGPQDQSPTFDQQPIEVASLADACALAYDLTGSLRWRAAVDLCWQWFLGHNDSGIAMYNEATGGGYDGLHGTGRNLNQGAESTLAALSTALQADRLGLS